MDQPEPCGAVEKLWHMMTLHLAEHLGEELIGKRATILQVQVAFVGEPEVDTTGEAEGARKGIETMLELFPHAKVFYSHKADMGAANNLEEVPPILQRMGMNPEEAAKHVSEMSGEMAPIEKPPITWEEFCEAMRMWLHQPIGEDT